MDWETIAQIAVTAAGIALFVFIIHAVMHLGEEDDGMTMASKQTVPIDWTCRPPGVEIPPRPPLVIERFVDRPCPPPDTVKRYTTMGSVIRAEQVRKHRIPDLLRDKMESHAVREHGTSLGSYVLTFRKSPTSLSDESVSDGDWIVQFESGSIRSMKNDVFKTLFREV